jgi:hypothetical protein
MKSPELNLAREVTFGKSLCGNLPKNVLNNLERLIRRHKISLVEGAFGWGLVRHALRPLASR